MRRNHRYVLPANLVKRIAARLYIKKVAKEARYVAEVETEEVVAAPDPGGLMDLDEALKGLSETEVEAAIREAIEKTGASGGKDMGKVIAQLKADYPGRIDFAKASGKVTAALG